MELTPTLIQLFTFLTTSPILAPFVASGSIVFEDAPTGPTRHLFFSPRFVLHILFPKKTKFRGISCLVDSIDHVETALLAPEYGIVSIPHLGYDYECGFYGNDAVVAEIVRVLTASEATSEEEREAIVRDTKTRLHAFLTASPTLHPHMESGAITAPELELGKWDWDHSLVIPISGKTQFSLIGVSIQDATTFSTYICGINRHPTSIAGLGYPLTWKEEYGGYSTTNLSFTSFQQVADEIHRLVATPEPPPEVE
jgi:hypothetical protein